MPKSTLGRLLPALIAAVLMVDLVARFLPLDRLCFQAWECMTRFQEPGSVFEANRQFRSDRTHGNLSNVGNLPALRQIRPQVFTTDANGFRNEPGLERTAPDGVVVGDSFTAGYGISDDETFPVRLSAATGRRFYNAGGPYAYLQTVRELKARMGFRQCPVIIVWTESEPVSQLMQAEASAREGDAKTRLLNSVAGPRGERWRSLMRGWWYTSPARIVAEKLVLSIANDRILPNIYRSRVVERRLQTGEPILFYPADVDGFHHHRQMDDARNWIAALAAAMTGEGLSPFVLLAPSKYTVYYPLLAPPQPEPGDSLHPLAALERDLRAAGIPALDLTPRFQEQARSDLQRGQYIYWLDDTHWNGQGVELAADLASRTWFTHTKLAN